MSRLLTIQEFIQQTVDAISDVIDFDMAIIDEDTSLVAGSGKYKNKIGYNFGKGSITHKLMSGNVFSNQETVFVPTPHYYDTCKDCQCKEECDIFAALVCSIKHESQVIGTISIFATNDVQRHAVIDNVAKYDNFLKKISSMISSKIGEKELSFRQVSRSLNYSVDAKMPQKTLTFADIRGSSKSMTDLKERMRRLAHTDSTILLSGESGTGKELFAQAIHFESPRANAAFIPINCGAIPEHLLESELFGYEDGAFTGAKKGGKPGKFELAHGGTIFLDEIGDMPLHLQVKLLRILQEKKFERVGGINPIWVNIRLIAATNRNLEEMIANGEFREDLFYRLSVIPFTIPPLRDRDIDILILARHFIEKFNSILGRSIKGFNEEAEDLLKRYGWPGNVRELENAMEYAVNIETDEVISINSFPPRIIAAPKKEASPSILGKNLGNMERDAIVEGLRQYGFNTAGKEKVAQALGISRATLYRRLKEFGIEG